MSSNVNLVYRRCHVCGTVTEGHQTIRRCANCTKAFAPFFYFNDQYAPVFAESELRPTKLEGERLPIHGLTAYWQND